MRAGWKELCAFSVAFQGQCSFERMTAVVAKYRQGWEDNYRACRKGPRRRNAASFDSAKEGGGGGGGKRRCTESRKLAPHAMSALDVDHAGRAATSVAGCGLGPGGMTPYFISGLMPGMSQMHGMPHAMLPSMPAPMPGTSTVNQNPRPQTLGPPEP